MTLEIILSDSGDNGDQTTHLQKRKQRSAGGLEPDCLPSLRYMGVYIPKEARLCSGLPGVGGRVCGASFLGWQQRGVRMQVLKGQYLRDGVGALEPQYGRFKLP